MNSYLQIREPSTEKGLTGRRRCLRALVPALLLAGSVCSYAQWQTQSLLIKPGWSAVYLHVDASYQSIDQLVGADLTNPIAELWLWQPNPTMQFASSPQTPTVANSQWINWARIGSGINSTLTTLVPNGAYLVHSLATTNFVWKLKGKPVAPQYHWTISGLNFIGFPTVPNNPPPFDSFLSLAPTLQSLAEIYQYPGGALGPTNPARLFAYHTTPVTRGQAFWIRAGTTFNNYFAPFEVALPSGGSGVVFGDSVSQYTFRLRNTTGTNLTVTLRLAASEPPPTGQTAIVAVPPMLVRGNLDTTTLTYGYTTLSASGGQNWTLTPQGQDGSDIVVVLGINRYTMTNNPGALYAGILQFTDSLGFSEVDVPVSAQVSSTAGLWVGAANVTQVANYLNIYQRDASNSVVVSSNGSYVITGVNTNLGTVAKSFPLRLIVHNNGSTAVLLQRAYYGLRQGTNLVVATQESLLDPAHLDTARRVSATHLPWTSTNATWSFNGPLTPGGTLVTTVLLPYDDQASNPFLHTYHPDHDNLDSTFKTELQQGAESYQVSRTITLNVTAPGNDFTSLTSAGQTLSGNYLETIVLGGLGGASRTFNVAGQFALNRISAIPILTSQ